MTPETAEMIQNTVNKNVRNGLIKSEVAVLIILNKYRAARFYILPKVYKTLHKLPGRPIMSANNDLTERLRICGSTYQPPCKKYTVPH